MNRDTQRGIVLSIGVPYASYVNRVTKKKKKKKIGKIKLRMSTIFLFYFGFYCVAQKAKYYEIKITI